MVKRIEKKKSVGSGKRIYGFLKRHSLIGAFLSLVISVVLFRISVSGMLFGSDINEFKLWFKLGFILFGLIGLLAINVWIKENVPGLKTRHGVNWNR